LLVPVQGRLHYPAKPSLPVRGSDFERDPQF
jgi:hypothetical protein